MFLATKAAWAGIVFILLTTGISRPRATPLASGANVSKEVPAAWNWNDVKKMQQILRDKGHYRGEVDGVSGLRTWASIRGFQKAENLPVTGQLDPQTAAKLGVRPEGRAESHPTETRPPAPGMRLWRELHHRGRWSLSRYSPRRSARIHAAPAIAKVSAVSLQFV